MSRLRITFENACAKIEQGFDHVFTPSGNPLRMLGALGWFFFWIVVISGIYLYIFFDSGIEQAYESVEYLTHTQWYAGGVMRSLHRYASDAMVVVILLHLVRELIRGRYSGARWFTWFTGVPVLWLLFAAGISGYWVVWDRLAQYVAIATTEWLDTLPLFGEAIARNFLHSDALNGRFFTLMVFIHIAVPLAMLFLMWIHIQRLAFPKVNPPRSVALGLLASMLTVALIKPALSQGPANLDTVVSEIGFDWFFLGAYPLLDVYRGDLLWLGSLCITIALLIVPWAIPQGSAGVAKVSLDDCNGCARCFNDCPFGAITMSPRSDGAAFAQEATVNPSRCVDCGICVGACPTATPFRRRSGLTPGIDLASQPLEQLREKLLSASAAAQNGSARTVTFVCEHGPRTPGADLPGTVMSLKCIGMLPPSFIDFLLMRGHFDGVMLAGCNADACYYRLGIRWVEGRLARVRDPYLRQRVPMSRLHTCWAGPTGTIRVASELREFQASLSTETQSDDDAD